MKPKTTHKNPSVQTSCSAVTTLPIPRRGPHAAMGIEILKLMKTKLSLIIALCAVFITASAFGQTVRVWGGGGDGFNLSQTTNWVGGVIPQTGGADVGQFDSTTPGDLHLIYNDGAYASGPGLNGINWFVETNHVGSVSISNTLSAPNYLAVQNITNNGQGAFFMGDSDSTKIFWIIKRPNGGIESWVNNSTTVATLHPWTRFAGGGGANWTYSFQGTGDWQINNYLQPDNGPSTTVQVDGPGTMYWNPTGFAGANGIVSPIVINAGRMVLQGPHPKISNQAWTLNGIFEFNAPSLAQTLSGAISGTTNGVLRLTSGTLTLSGASTYAGTTVLNGGKLIVNRAENPGTSGPLGLGGTISFAGGTLAYTVLNSADYSARFSTNANQAYRIDTSGDGSANNVTFSNALTSNGGTLTKLGSGTLTLSGTNANTYSGLTTISAGELLLQAPKSGSANITVADGATLGVFGNGSQVTPATLTLGTASGANLEFDNVSSTTLAPLAPVAISATGPITINIGSGSFNTIGQVFPLFSWGSGSAPTVVLGTVNGANGTLVTNGNTLALKITATAFIYTGLNGGVWDLATPNNWKQSGSPVVFANGAPALMDDSAATGTPYVSIAANVAPSVFTVNNNVINYTLFTYSGLDIQGGTGFTKSGNAPLAIYGPNEYTGVTTLNGGVTTVDTLDNGGASSSIGAATKSAANLVLNGGTLQYIGGGATIDRSFTLGPSGGGIDSSGAAALNLTNTGAVGLNGAGPHTLVLTGVDPNNDLFALSLTDSVAGATALTKAGLGTWVLTGTNNYSGVTAIQGGTLQFGVGGATGSIGSGNVTDNGTLILNRTGNVTVGGLISGSGSVSLQGGGTFTLTAKSTYSGGTRVGTNTTLQLTGSGTLNPNANIVNNGTVFMDSSTALNISGFQTGISGIGNVVVNNNRTVSLIDWATFGGWLLINPGATFQPCYGNEGNFWCSVVTNNGTLLFIRQDNNAFIYSNNIVGSGKVVKDNNNANAGDVTLSGTNNTYTGGTWIQGGGIILSSFYRVDTNSNTTNYIAGGNIVGNVYFTNTATGFKNSRYLIINRDDNYTFTNNIVGAVTTNDGSAGFNQGSVTIQGAGVITLTGNNTYPSGTTIATNATLQVGNGGTSGSVGTGGVVVNPGGRFFFNRSDNVTFANAITGQGSFVQFGSGTVTLSNTNDTYSGDTTVSNGTLVTANVSGNLNVNGGTVVTTNVVGNVNVNSGTFATAAGGSVGALTALNNLNISGGTVQVSLDKTRSDITSYLFVITAVNYTNGTLKLINAGPALTVGDTFQISYLPVARGNTMPVVSPGFTVTNHLGDDGTVVVTAVTASVLKVTPVVSGGLLTMSWPSAWKGLHLQVQTNTLAQGLGNNWVNIPGSDAVTGYTNSIDKANGSVFYRLAP